MTVMDRTKPDGDGALVEALRREDPEAPEQLVERYGDRVYRLALRITGSISEALGRPGDAFHAAEQAVEAVVNVLLTVLAVFYFLMDGRRLGAYALRFVPPEQQGHVAVVGPRIHRVLGRFLGGQMLLVALMSAVTFAPSPMISMSFVLISPVKVPSMRTVPSKLSLPSNSEPRPRSAFRALSAGVCARSCMPVVPFRSFSRSSGTVSVGEWYADGPRGRSRIRPRAGIGPLG